MTGYTCICAKAAMLHYIGSSENYCPRTVLRGLTRQNYRVWTTKLRVFEPHRCILSIAVAYLRVDKPKSLQVLRHTGLRKASEFLKYPIVPVKLFTTHRVNNVQLFRNTSITNKTQFEVYDVLCSTVFLHTGCRTLYTVLKITHLS
jgi:hypothetical protein